MQYEKSEIDTEDLYIRILTLRYYDCFSFLVNQDDSRSSICNIADEDESDDYSQVSRNNK